jgi:glycosyltransferase involved in cell wall biosynthesis
MLIENIFRLLYKVVKSMRSPIIIHLITDRLYPQSGGLAETALRVARVLESLDEVRVIIYVRADDFSVQGRSDETALDGLTIHPIASYREVSERPLVPQRLFQHNDLTEMRNWLDYLQVRNLIARHRDEFSKEAHLILSFAVAHAGFVAQQVAINLSLPHITSIRGSDYSIAIHNSCALPLVSFVIEHADFIVTTNDEQLRFLERVYGVKSKARRIHNSVSGRCPKWSAPQRLPEHIRLVSDCGYSFKKGTEVLLDAFESMASTDDLAQLSIFGGQPPEELQSKHYWARRRRELSERLRHRLELADAVPRSNVDAAIESAHLYCSATLGEGCSNARITALVSGIPIVSTRCGELPDVADNVSHVRLAQPGDAQEFQRILSSACQDLRNGRLHVDNDHVEAWSHYFHPRREAQEWSEVIRRF